MITAAAGQRMAIVERARQHWVVPRDVILAVPMIPNSSKPARFRTGPRPTALVCAMRSLLEGYGDCKSLQANERKYRTGIPASVPCRHPDLPLVQSGCSERGQFGFTIAASLYVICTAVTCTLPCTLLPMFRCHSTYLMKRVLMLCASCGLKRETRA